MMDATGTTATLRSRACEQTRLLALFEAAALAPDMQHGTPGYSLAYTYNHNANRLTKVVGSGGSAVTTTSTYGTHDQLLTSGSKSYGYDSNGNCTSVTVGTSVTSLTYDYENRVVGMTYPSSATNSFAYNGNDLRMQKVDSAGTANYVCDGTTPASAVLKDGSAVYTPGLSERRGTTSKFYDSGSRISFFVGEGAHLRGSQRNFCVYYANPIIRWVLGSGHRCLHLYTFSNVHVPRDTFIHVRWRTLPLAWPACLRRI